MELPSTKPYLLRALWEWCVDNGFTPHIAVQVDAFTMVPREFVRDGQIVLNLGPDATNKLQMGNELIEFHARFSGVARQLSIPISQVSAIYARENGAGTMFEPEAAYDEDASIMNDEEASADNETVMSVIDGDKPDHDDDTHPDDEPPQPPRGGRPALRVVK